MEHRSELLRRCDRKTQKRGAAESVFFTLGGKQVGAGAIVGWSKVLAPNLSNIRLWPFDGDLPALIETPGLVVAEIYPAEAYSHLGFKMGRPGWSKRNREDRKKVAPQLLAESMGAVKISDEARLQIEGGFQEEDDFDATVGLFAMLQVITGRRSCAVPDDPYVREIEGWILGQDVDNAI
jgi:hypothetical protein